LAQQRETQMSTDSPHVAELRQHEFHLHKQHIQQIRVIHNTFICDHFHFTRWLAANSLLISESRTRG